MNTIKVIEARSAESFETMVGEHLKHGWQIQDISSSSTCVFKGDTFGNHNDFYKIYKYFSAVLTKETE